MPNIRAAAASTGGFSLLTRDTLLGRAGGECSGIERKLGNAEYSVGDIIADYLEVVERGNDKVIIRRGDPPLVRGDRSNGRLFLLAVTKDEKFANFYMKSISFDSTAQGDKTEKVPEWRYFAHTVCVRILMRSGIEAVEGRK
ncbi:unnamed protein product [Tuber aestivum]|uniref:Uncharacterized protein n=1 Tax=Tuber aestivum TaxID=59557 RepID=A0A292Q7F7_9PEZI|nr:unnamed protein product [Tuber aestivum]